MEHNFFTAAEAKERSNTINNSNIECELEFIYKKIHEYVNKGKTECTFYNKSFSQEANEFLESKGFKVSWWGGSQRDPANDTTISWK